MRAVLASILWTALSATLLSVILFGGRQLGVGLNCVDNPIDPPPGWVMPACHWDKLQAEQARERQLPTAALVVAAGYAALAVSALRPRRLRLPSREARTAVPASPPIPDRT